MVYDYDKFKSNQADISRNRSTIGRDIGDLSAVKNIDKRNSCKLNFKLFCETYLKHIFSLTWSENHLKAIVKIEKSILQGGLFAFAMPRGSGKTSLTEAAALWALLYGHRKFVVVVGADETAAVETLDSIKIEIETNEKLLEDFPEVVYPIVKLEGISNRCNGQTFKGNRTHISWTNKEIILPTMPCSVASGSVIRTSGITGRLRGMKSVTADGKSIRPDAVILDDAQTDDSARSLSQTYERMKIVSGAILGLAGPKKKISGFAPCTVIRRNDLADTLLNTEKYPQWQGERFKLVDKMPSNEPLWAEYDEIRRQSLADRGDISLATEFYRQHQAAMDVGAVITWIERFNPDEISAIQYAMNLKFTDEQSFYSEYQNEPLKENESFIDELSADDILTKCNGAKRYSVTDNEHSLTAAIDVQKNALYYVVTSWGNDGSGSIIDYGTYPQQNSDYYKYSEIQRTIEQVHKGLTLEASIYEALTVLVNQLCGKDYQGIRIEKLLIDSGYLAEVIYKFAKQSAYATIIMASKGLGIGASRKPISEYTIKRGEKRGNHCYQTRIAGSRLLHVDTNYWKSQLYTKLKTHVVDKGGLTIYGNERQHKMLAENITAEYPISVTNANYGRTVDEWQEKPNRDNHLLDCLTYATCAASLIIQNVSITKTDKANTAKPQVKQRRQSTMIL
jgi:hypothetical protein